MLRWFNATRENDELSRQVSKLYWRSKFAEMKVTSLQIENAQLAKQRDEAWAESSHFSAILAQSTQSGVETYTQMMEEAYGVRLL